MIAMETVWHIGRLPLAVIFLGSLAITFLSIELGSRLGKWTRGRWGLVDKIQTGPLVATSLSLLAFMLAIVFSVVDSRFNELKHIVLDEANAIGTAELRADLLPPAQQSAVKGLLRDYMDLRIESVQNRGDQPASAMRRTRELHNELWTQAVDAAAQAPTPVSALFVQSLNELIDLHEKLVTLDRYRLPGIIWVVLFCLAVLAMTMGGYDSGLTEGRRFTAVTLAAALAFSMVLTLVVALDRPDLQLLTTTRAAVIDLQEEVLRSMDP